MYLRLLLACFTLVLSSCSEEYIEEIDTHSNGVIKEKRTYLVDGKSKFLKNSKKYYADAQLEMEGTYNLKGQKHGKFIYYYPNGNTWSVNHFENGKRHGLNESYYKNGKIRYRGYFKNDLKSGKWQFFDESGVKIKELDL